MPRRDSIPVLRSKVSARVRAFLPSPLSSMSMSSYSFSPSCADRQPAGGDKAPRRERGQAELVRPAFGIEPPLDDGKGAFGLRVTGGSGQRQVDAQAMVTAGVAKAGGHAHDALLGLQRHGGGDLHRLLARAPPCAAVDVLRPPVVRRDHGARPQRSPFAHDDADSVGGIDGVIDRWWERSCRSHRGPRRPRAGRTR